jgi:hypothetical protein
MTETSMTTEYYEYKSDFARYHYGRGWVAGWVKGWTKFQAEDKARATARAILALLSAHGIDVREEARVRIGECADLVRLESWVCRATTASSADDLFD